MSMFSFSIPFNYPLDRMHKYYHTEFFYQYYLHLNSFNVYYSRDFISYSLDCVLRSIIFVSDSCVLPYKQSLPLIYIHIWIISDWAYPVEECVTY